MNKLEAKNLVLTRKIQKLAVEIVLKVIETESKKEILFQVPYLLVEK